MFNTIKNILTYQMYSTQENLFNVLDDAILNFDRLLVDNYKSFVNKFNIKHNFLNFKIGKDEDAFSSVSLLQEQVKNELSSFNEILSDTER